MRKRLKLLLYATVSAVLVSPLAGQTNRNDSFVVRANNIGLFECVVAETEFDFGDVDASGTVSGPNATFVGRTGADDGGIYQNDSGTVNWTCRGAPQRTVDIFLTSIAGDYAGVFPVDALEVRIPDAGSGTPTAAFQTFTSGAQLYDDLIARNGANAANGTVELQLTVLDTDPIGAGTWTVNLQFQGTP